MVLLFAATLAVGVVFDWWQGLTTALPPHLRPAAQALPQAAPLPAASPQAAPAPDLAWPQARTRFAALRAAYAARAELERLDRTGVIRLPHRAHAALENASRGQLPA
jgi:hypothetical protein